jgi:hypothetical protein
LPATSALELEQIADKSVDLDFGRACAKQAYALGSSFFLEFAIGRIGQPFDKIDPKQDDAINTFTEEFMNELQKLAERLEKHYKSVADSEH